MDKKKLIDDVDGSIADISTIVDYRALEESRNRKKKCKLLSTSALLCFLLVFVSFLVVHLFIKYSDREIFKFKEGPNGVMQTVHSSVAENYVEYFVPVSSDERNWILDDFNTELTVFKSEQSSGQRICFVAKMDKTIAVKPTEVHEGAQPYKDHISGIYTTDETPLKDKSVLGPYGLKLCEDSNVYWMRKTSDAENMMDLDNTDEPLAANISSLTGTHHRDKRRIRQCRASCCWRVCCCDITHFTWETAELFTCAHVCNKCTKQYKYAINKLC